MPMTLHTIGYEGIDVERFLGILRTHGIETVIDVRELPLSRKPEFSKAKLANRLRLNGVGYVHMRALGCPRRIRHRYRADGHWGRYEQGFLAHLEMQGDALASLGALALQSQSALLCFEADAQSCHRSIVAASISRLTETSVFHIPNSAAASEPRGAHDSEAFEPLS